MSLFPDGCWIENKSRCDSSYCKFNEALLSVVLLNSLVEEHLVPNNPTGEPYLCKKLQVEKKNC